MLKEGDLVRYYTIEHAYYAVSDANTDIGIIINASPIFANNSDYSWYVILLDGKIRTAREDDVYQLTGDEDV